MHEDYKKMLDELESFCNEQVYKFRKDDNGSFRYFSDNIEKTINIILAEADKMPTQIDNARLEKIVRTSLEKLAKTNR